MSTDAHSQSTSHRSAGQEVVIAGSTCPLPSSTTSSTILLGHGGGGLLSRELLDTFLSTFDDDELRRLGDAAVVDVDGLRLAFTTDAFVVQPTFFPGGDIGALAVYGTVNDLAMMGARPIMISAALILEEGLPLDVLQRVVDSMAAACATAQVRLVTGDTKVVEHGSADGIYIVTSGIGVVPTDIELGPERAQPGDAVIISGPIANHGVAVMSGRAGIAFETQIESDAAPLTDLVQVMLAAGPLRCLRDPTRGGLAAALNELAAASNVSVTINDTDVPLLPGAHAACEMLGLDPFYVANEGICVAIAPNDHADAIVRAARAHPLGQHASIIGHVGPPPVGVSVRTALGATRRLLLPSGDLLPRIC